MRIAMVVPGIADHIGDDRHAHDPFQPKRAKTFLAAHEALDRQAPAAADGRAPELRGRAEWA